jgi:hypothetical protein
MERGCHRNSLSAVTTWCSQIPVKSLSTLSPFQDFQSKGIPALENQVFKPCETSSAVSRATARMTFVLSTCNCDWMSSAALDMLVVREVAERDPSNEVEQYHNQYANSRMFASSGMVF